MILYCILDPNCTELYSCRQLHQNRTCNRNGLLFGDVNHQLCILHNMFNFHCSHETGIDYILLMWLSYVLHLSFCTKYGTHNTPIGVARKIETKIQWKMVLVQSPIANRQSPPCHQSIHNVHPPHRHISICILSFISIYALNKHNKNNQN